MKPRLAIVVSHPIQHFVALYRELALCTDIDLKVVFGSRIGLDSYYDAGFATMVRWNPPKSLTDGYQHEFLPSAPSVKDTSFFALRDPSVYFYLKRYKPTMVMVYGYSQLFQILTLAWCRLHRIPCVMTGDSELIHYRPLWKRMLKRLFLPLLLKQFYRILSVGDNCDEYYRNYGVALSRILRLPFPIDEASFAQLLRTRAEAKKQFRLHYNIPVDAFVVLFVGKLIARKRPLDLIRLLAIDCGRPLVLFVAGTGPLAVQMQSCKEASSSENTNTCILAGFVNIDMLPRAYIASDILVHPAEADPHPLICSEAAFCGLPMVVSDRLGCIGPTDVARPDINALVFPCGDTEEMARLVTRLAVDAGLLSGMSEMSGEIAEELSLQKSVAIMKTVLCEF